MNIVILPAWFRLKANRTNGSFFLEQAVAMAKAGHKVTLINAQLIPTRIYLATERDVGIKHYIENGVEIYEYKTGAFLTGRSAPLTIKLYEMKVERLLKKVLRKQKIDVLHAHSFYPSGIAAVRLGKKYNIPVVLTEHSSSFIKDWLHIKGVYDYVKPTFDEADATVCVTEFLADYIYRKYDLAKKPIMIGNVLNPVFQYLPKPENEVFTFVMIARLTEIKRVNHIISAVAELKQQGIRVLVHIAGDGPLRESLECQAKELHVQDFLKFHGNLSREEVYELLGQSNALVHASVTETFGVVYIESMASGRPVVTAENGGAYELINESNGYLAEPDDPHSLAETMKKMI
ncbi:MAG: glycosyltransferase [Clostridia bacterium]|nr:glycosyltransferase [Clostridia bacterium]